ncbi:hypothetical protein DPM33_12725 [Mesorhizobium hawassense]|uniref:Uncharacterized protein n=1 Tax=Mesorhizobium hawassense TaxID=1209954 RepID=A0A330HUX5_9HYPH|nr:hypothetical protein [Mesorhizobium hawassense]RAZ90389.1 hypothetical protein DPM33_12725 [Mesorhizobium hawassense]
MRAGPWAEGGNASNLLPLVEGDKLRVAAGIDFSGYAALKHWREDMNNIIWLVGAVVIVLFILGFLGFR